MITNFNILYILSPSATIAGASGGGGEGYSNNLFDCLIKSNIKASLDISIYTKLMDLRAIKKMQEAAFITPTVLALQQEMQRTGMVPSLSGIPASSNIMLHDLPATKNVYGEATQHLGILNKYPSIPLPAARMLVMLSQLRSPFGLYFYDQNEIGFTFKDHYLMARDSQVPRAEYYPEKGFGSALQADLSEAFPYECTIPGLLAHSVKEVGKGNIKDGDLLEIMADLASQIATKDVGKSKEFKSTLISFAKTLWIKDGNLLSEGIALMDLVKSRRYDINENRENYWRPIYNFFRSRLLGMGMSIAPFVS